MADTSARDRAIEPPAVEFHSDEDGCYFCASDGELLAGLAGKALPRTLHMQLPPQACPHMNEEDRHV